MKLTLLLFPVLLLAQSAVDPASPVERTWTGVLMDASCAAIKPDDFATGEKRKVETNHTNTVADKYKDCMVTSNTKIYAIRTASGLVKLNAASNEMVSMQLKGESLKDTVKDASGAPKWTTVTIAGSLSENEIKATKISK